MSHTSTTIETTVTAEIALEPSDWEFATWRPRTPKPRSPIRPFDRDECLARLRRVQMASSSHSAPDWTRAGLANTTSREEAQFWFLAMTEPERDLRQSQLVTELQRHPLTGEMSRDEVRHRLRHSGIVSILILIPLSNLLSPTELIACLLDDQLCVVDPYSHSHYQVTTLQLVLVDGFREYVRPYLDDATLQEMQQAARARLSPSLWTQATPPTLEQLVGYRLAPLLNMYPEVASIVANWPDHLFPVRGSYEEWRRMPRELLYGMGDPWLMEQQARRLRLYCRSEVDARAWLAHTEFRALDWLVESIRHASGHSSSRIIDVLCLVRSPAAAQPLLELHLSGHSCPAIRHWFETQVGNFVAGILPLIRGRGKLAEAARNCLRDVKRRGGSAIIEQQIAQTDEITARRVQHSVLDYKEIDYPLINEATTPAWLSQAMMELPPLSQTKSLDWIDLESLAPLVVGDRALTPTHVRAVLRTLEIDKFEAPTTLLSELRRHVTASSREAFVQSIVEQWRRAGSNQRDEWVLRAYGFLGGDESVLQLVTMIREGTGSAGVRHALQALQCLSAIGSSLALQQLAAISRSTRTRSIRESARTLLDDLAIQRGISRGELDDLSVPSLGFEGDRPLMLDFGPRRFEVILTSGPRLVLRDGEGKIRENLPAINSRDDVSLAREAINRWRILRRSLKEAIKEQSARLERAMVAGQRWSLRHFREKVLKQPLLVQLARLLLWGTYDDRGRLTSLFRLTEEGTFVDAEENPYPLWDVNSVRVIHPIEMTESQRQIWSMTWRDHELIQPFAQLGRPIYLLSDEQRQQKAITQYRGRRIPALNLISQLKRQDWMPARIGTSERNEAHFKTFRLWDLTAVLHHREMGEYVYPSHLSVQELHSASFFRGTKEAECFDPEEAIPLGEVADLPRSEVQELMARIYARGKD